MALICDLPSVEVGGDTLHGVVLKSVEAHGPRPALIDGSSGQCLKYAELGNRVRSMASALMARGYGPGDVLALCMPNIPAVAEISLGSLAAGMTVAMASPAYKEHELADHMSACRAKVLFTIPPLTPLALKVAATTGMREVVVIGQAKGCISISELLSAPPAIDLPDVDEEATALIYQSSGTTDLPKGVELTHRNLVAAIRQTRAAIRMMPSDTTLTITPLFHVMGFVAMLTAPLSVGACVVTLPSFDPRQLVELIDYYQVTILVGAPPMMPTLLSDQAGQRTKSLEVIISGGAALTLEVEEALREHFPATTVGQAWGLTEFPPVSITRRGWNPSLGSVGRLIPNTQLRVVDPASGDNLPTNVTGELWVAGPQAMKGYLDNPQATAAMLDDEGWLHTGDLGHIDAEGNIYLTGRLNEVIYVGDNPVYPRELEALLVSHPDVEEAVVVGRPDDLCGAVPVAYVVKHADVAKSELISWLCERVDQYKCIRDVHFVKIIPKTPAGKILRRLLVK